MFLNFVFHTMSDEHPWDVKLLGWLTRKGLVYVFQCYDCYRKDRSMEAQILLARRWTPYNVPWGSYSYFHCQTFWYYIMSIVLWCCSHGSFVTGYSNCNNYLECLDLIGTGSRVCTAADNEGPLVSPPSSVSASDVIIVMSKGAVHVLYAESPELTE